LHGYALEQQPVATPAERFRHEVVVPFGNPSGHEDKVGFLPGVFDLLKQLIQVVSRDAIVSPHNPHPSQLSAQLTAVAVPDVSAVRRFPRFHEFIARGHHGDDGARE